ERAVRLDVEVDAEHVPAPLVLDEGERLDPARARRLLAGLQVGEGHDATLLDGLLQRWKGRVAQAQPRREADDRFVDEIAERADLAQSAACVVRHGALT